MSTVKHYSRDCFRILQCSYFVERLFSCLFLPPSFSLSPLCLSCRRSDMFEVSTRSGIVGECGREQECGGTQRLRNPVPLGPLGNANSRVSSGLRLCFGHVDRLRAGMTKPRALPISGSFLDSGGIPISLSFIQRHLRVCGVVVCSTDARPYSFCSSPSSTLWLVGLVKRL